jgi:hypothetical protein
VAIDEIARRGGVLMRRFWAPPAVPPSAVVP